jgi:Saxitoxin biosynthesis operon protein SxtJ
MALIDQNHEPTPGELRVFGILLAAFGGVLGGLVLHHTGSWPMASVIWSVALLFSTFYYAVPAARYMVYRTWMTAAYPMGWLISHSLLAVIYYLVITPIGLAMRLGGRDPLQRAPDRSATTYWTPATTDEDIGRYFQQF